MWCKNCAYVKSFWKGFIAEKSTILLLAIYYIKPNCLNPQDNASDRANRIFGNLDVNCDGEVSEQEFIKGCMLDEDLVETLRGENDDDDTE